VYHVLAACVCVTELLKLALILSKWGKKLQGDNFIGANMHMKQSTGHPVVSVLSHWYISVNQ
jgi:hypothetical protein